MSRWNIQYNTCEQCCAMSTDWLCRTGGWLSLTHSEASHRAVELNTRRRPGQWLDSQTQHKYYSPDRRGWIVSQVSERVQNMNCVKCAVQCEWSLKEGESFKKCHCFSCEKTLSQPLIKSKTLRNNWLHIKTRGNCSFVLVPSLTYLKEEKRRKPFLKIIIFAHQQAPRSWWKVNTTLSLSPTTGRSVYQQGMSQSASSSPEDKTRQPQRLVIMK